MNKVSEKSVQNRIMRYLNSLPKCRVRCRKGGPENAGEPDIYGCINGQHFEIEVKAPGGRLRKLQKEKLKRWEETGCLTLTTSDPSEVEAIITPSGINRFGKE